MEANSNRLEIIQSIIAATHPEKFNRNDFSNFYEDLKNFSFRPFSNRFETIPLSGALERWHDLKPVVKGRLAEALVSFWNDSSIPVDTSSEEVIPQESGQQQEKPNDLPVFKEESNNDSALSGADHNKSNVASAYENGSGNFLKTPVRHDWFDKFIDFVACFFSP